MFKRLLARLFDLLLDYFGLERKAARDAADRKALDDAQARSDAAVADLGDGLRGLDRDPDNRDNR